MSYADDLMKGGLRAAFLSQVSLAGVRNRCRVFRVRDQQRAHHDTEIRRGGDGEKHAPLRDAARTLARGRQSHGKALAILRHNAR